jgi:hypothetical protein
VLWGPNSIGTRMDQKEKIEDGLMFSQAGFHKQDVLSGGWSDARTEAEEKFLYCLT